MSVSPSSKPQVSFHFNAPDKLDYACRFIRKAMRHDARVTVVAPLERLRQLSARLWKLGSHEFLAHAVQGDDVQLMQLAPVVLVENVAHTTHYEVLLHLGWEVPEGFESFSKVVEVVSSFDEQDRAQARERWRTYQLMGHTIERHDLVLNGG